MTICTSLSSKWPVFQASIFSAFAVYIIVLGSVAFMCRSMMKTLMIHKKGTVAVKGEPGQQEQYLRKSESSEGKSSRRQIILFLGKRLLTPALFPKMGRKPRSLYLSKFFHMRGLWLEGEKNTVVYNMF